MLHRNPSRTTPLIAKHRHRRRAFSLAEMIVVVMIIVFASTVAVLSYGNYRKGATVRGAAERIRAVMMEARTRAIATNRPARVVFDLQNQSVWVDELEANLSMRTPKVVPPEYLGPDVAIQRLQVNSAVYTTGIRNAVFNPDGTNAFTTVQVRRNFDDGSVDENYYSVQIYPNSAEARVWANARR